MTFAETLKEFEDLIRKNLNPSEVFAGPAEREKIQNLSLLVSRDLPGEFLELYRRHDGQASCEFYPYGEFRIYSIEEIVQTVNDLKKLNQPELDDWLPLGDNGGNAQLYINLKSHEVLENTEGDVSVVAGSLEEYFALLCRKIRRKEIVWDGNTWVDREDYEDQESDRESVAFYESAEALIMKSPEKKSLLEMKKGHTREVYGYFESFPGKGRFFYTNGGYLQALPVEAIKAIYDEAREKKVYKVTLRKRGRFGLKFDVLAMEEVADS